MSLFSFAFISEALAETADVADAAGPSVQSSLLSFVPMIIIFVIFYFLMIRPQQKKIKAHNKMLDSIKKGDKVLTNGGLIGHVSKVDTEKSLLVVKFAEGFETQVIKSAIAQIMTS